MAAKRLNQDISTEGTPAVFAASGKTIAGGATVLQVLPALETGGVERGTVDVANAVVAAGGDQRATGMVEGAVVAWGRDLAFVAGKLPCLAQQFLLLLLENFFVAIDEGADVVFFRQVGRSFPFGGRA